MMTSKQMHEMFLAEVRDEIKTMERDLERLRVVEKYHIKKFAAGIVEQAVKAGEDTLSKLGVNPTPVPPQPEPEQKKPTPPKPGSVAEKLSKQEGTLARKVWKYTPGRGTQIPSGYIPKSQARPLIDGTPHIPE